MRIEATVARIACLGILGLIVVPAVVTAQAGTLFVEGSSVGIGVAAPTEILHVRKTTAGNTLAFLENNTGPERVGARYKNSLAQWDFRMDGAGNFIFDNTATAGEDLAIRQNGQVRVGPAPAKILLQPNGDIDIQGTLHEGSSRDSKHAFESLDPRDVLAKIVDLEVLEWSYKDQGSRHVGPMAEDFQALFGLGASSDSLAPRDVAGVALLSLQGLHELVLERDAQIEQLQRELVELRAMVETLASR